MQWPPVACSSRSSGCAAQAVRRAKRQPVFNAIHAAETCHAHRQRRNARCAPQRCQFRCVGNILRADLVRDPHRTAVPTVAARSVFVAEADRSREHRCPPRAAATNPPPPVRRQRLAAVKPGGELTPPNSHYALPPYAVAAEARPCGRKSGSFGWRRACPVAVSARADSMLAESH